MDGLYGFDGDFLAKGKKATPSKKGIGKHAAKKSSGKKKIFTQIVIDNSGSIEEVRVRAPHPKLREEIRSILMNLPQFIPGENEDRRVKVKYNLPINLA